MPLLFVFTLEMSFRNVTTDIRHTTQVYSEIQRAIPGGDRYNQYCVNLFGKGMDVADIQLYIRPRCTKPTSN